MQKILGWLTVSGLSVAAVSAIGGCPTTGLEQLINTAADAVNRTIDNLQEQDILSAPNLQGAEDAGLGVELGDDVDVITDPETELANVDGKTATLLAFENGTEHDMYLSYVVNGRSQKVLVYADETTLLRYPCIQRVLMLAEWDFDPETEEFVRGYEFRGGRFDNPDGDDVDLGDFDCPDPNDFFGDFDPNTDPGDPNGLGDPNSLGDPNMSFDPNSFDPNDMTAQDEPVASPCGDAVDVPLRRPGTKMFRGESTGFRCGQLIVIHIDDDTIEIRTQVSLEDETESE